jgi:hypothetical protein
MNSFGQQSSGGGGGDGSGGGGGDGGRPVHREETVWAGGRGLH